MISIAVTGHRPNKLWGYDLSRPKYKELEALLIMTIADIWNDKSRPKFMHEVPIECISGMALGVDTVFANAALKLKAQFTGVKFIAAIPCIEQDRLWREQDKIQYNNLLELADETVYISKEPYIKGCMNARNQYMIDRCNVLIAVWNGDKHGGTHDVIQRAMKANKEIITIDPRQI